MIFDRYIEQSLREDSVICDADDFITSHETIIDGTIIGGIALCRTMLSDKTCRDDTQQDDQSDRFLYSSYYWRDALLMTVAIVH